MKYVLVFAISLLCLTTPALPDTLRPLEGVSNVRHQLLKLDEGLKKDLQQDPNWRICGDYFAKKGYGEEKIVLFIFEKKPFTEGLERNMVFAYTNVEWIDLSVTRDTGLSTVFVRDDERGRKFQLKMNLEDYATWLSCFGKGRKYQG